MSLHYGNKNITKVYYGSKKIKEIYKGSKLLFGGELELTSSYIITTGGTRIDFELDNTPLSNISTTGSETSSITINGQSVVKNTIKKIYFGPSYNTVTSIGDYFLYDCTSLTTLIMGAETPPTLGSYAFNSTNNLSLIQVPCASESAYKSATNWNAKASIIQGDC